MKKTAMKRQSNGSGTVYFDDIRKKWCGEIQWKDKAGITHRKKFSAKKQTIVKNKLESFRRQLLMSSGDIREADVLFEDYANNWVETTLQNKLKPSSLERKVVTLKHQVFPNIGGIPINKITNDDIQGMVNELKKQKLSYSTIKKAYEATSGCIRDYRVKAKIPFNPCEGVTLPENERRSVSNIVFFDDNQRKLIKDECATVYKNGNPVYRLGQAIIVLMYTGMRAGELLALEWDDIDFAKKTISITKNAVMVKESDDDEVHYVLLNQNSTKTYSSSRVIPMTNTALNALLEIKKINADKKYVCSTSSGKQILPGNVNRMFHKMLKRTGIAKDDSECCGVHALRHTFASMLFNNGCDVKVVSEILGHSNTKITENIYIHIIQHQKVRAIQDIDKYSE